MVFLGPDDFLVLEKDKGTVQRVTNGTIHDQPLLDLNVDNEGERGMLGIRDHEVLRWTNIRIYLLY